ncbi:MAG: DsrE family protein [Gammaproteobacteria bacterium]|nr:DsrE family protein [Gammaproteobacteria bacterium]
MKTVTNILLAIVASMLVLGTAVAADMGAAHKVVIQVSSADAKIQAIALNNAVNVQKHYGPGEVEVEIVAYGPGLSLLTKKSTQADRVASLAKSDITFSACGNTMKKVAKKSGKEPKLIDGVKVVNAGVVRLMELQEKGYSYIRP